MGGFIMQYRPLGQSGIEASVVALGTWAIGGWMWGGTEEQDALEAIETALDEGVNLIDTAPAYGLGRAEELVGKAVAGRRDRVIIATKCGLVWHVDQGEYFFDEYDKKVHKYLGPESIRYEIEQSLRRLKTDYIDLYQTHWQDASTPIEETMAALLDLKCEGKIAAIGVSNATVDQIEEYRRLGAVDCDQEQYNMLDRHIEETLLPYCHEHAIAMLAYSPLAKGLLTGKMGPDHEFRGDDHRQSLAMFSRESRGKVAEMLKAIKPIAADRKLTVSQAVLAWTLAQPGLTHVLVGARNHEQARENAEAGGVVLTQSELAQIDKAIATYAAGIPVS